MADITRTAIGCDLIVISVCPRATTNELMRDVSEFSIKVTLRTFNLVFRETTEQ